MYTFEKTTTITADMFEDLLDTAGYGIGYWCRKAKHETNTYTIWFDGSDFDGDHPASSGKLVLGYRELGDAIKLVAGGETNAGSWLVEQCNDWLNGKFTMDTELADVVIQVCAFDEIIYG